MAKSNDPKSRWVRKQIEQQVSNRTRKLKTRKRDEPTHHQMVYTASHTVAQTRYYDAFLADDLRPEHQDTLVAKINGTYEVVDNSGGYSGKEGDHVVIAVVDGYEHRIVTEPKSNTAVETEEIC